MQPGIIPHAMGHPDEHFSVAYTLPRLRGLFLRELTLAGIEIGLDGRLPGDVSSEACERLAVEVEERCRALADQPQEARGERSPALRCWFLARAFLVACTYESAWVVAGVEEDLLAMDNDTGEFYWRLRPRQAKLEDAIHALEIDPFLQKVPSWESLFVNLKALLASLQSLPLPPGSPRRAVPRLQDKIFTECRDQIAYLLGKTRLPTKDLAPVFYAGFDKDPDGVSDLFRGRLREARKKFRSPEVEGSS